MPFDDQLALDDDALLALFAGGEQRAANVLTARFLPRVYAHAARLVGVPAEAEDIAQEAMLRLWKIAPKWRPGEASVRTWLYRVTANLAIDALRRRRTTSSEAVDELIDPARPASEVMQDNMRLDALQSGLMQLPERQRQAVILRHIEGMTNPQIAQIMQINVAAVESLTARGKRALTALLAGRKDELGYQDD